MKDDQMDVVKRLNEKLAGMPELIYRECGPVMAEARSEIERLRRENASLRAAARQGEYVD